MIETANLKREHEEIYPRLEKLKEEALFIITQELDANNIKTHSVLSRIKSFESYFAKVRRKDIVEPLKEVIDLVGIRIVVLLRSDLERVAKIIREYFVVITEDNKIDNQETASFGYMSNHFVVKLKDSYTGPRYDLLRELICEIQIRTIAMDAWATISHYLDYKTDHDVPTELKKDFYALSGLFYVADTHFEFFYKSKVDSRASTGSQMSSKSDYEGVEINLDSLVAYLQNKLPSRKISDSDSVSELIEELHEAGYQNIGELDDVIDKGSVAFEKYESDNPPITGQFANVGVVRSTLKIVDNNFLHVHLNRTHMDKYMQESQREKYTEYRHFISS